RPPAQAYRRLRAISYRPGAAGHLAGRTGPHVQDCSGGALVKHCYFITGTDTEIGKTTIAAGLLHAARLRGLTTAAVKPVGAGCWRTAAGLRNDDALTLQAECFPPLDYALLNPVALEPAIAPHIAAAEAGLALNAASLAVDC